jgi:hypothetical protein
MMRTRNLLLSSVAGLLSVTAAQAADLPVKAKPVEYVKVCNLYGVGFYYMPGTDLCLKIGGWVRAEAGWGYNGSLTWGPFNGNNGGRSVNNLLMRGRGYITADAREQTAYGTARGYIAVGISTNTVGLDTAANQFSANRAFVQFAGITAGISQSFYEYYLNSATYGTNYPSSDTGDPGWLVFGYTAQFGNGLSATLSLEERRTTQIIDQTAFTIPTTGTNGAGSAAAVGNLVPGSFATAASPATANNGAYGGQQVGDIVGNLRLDQAWGGAQIMGALHDVNATYYSTAAAVGPLQGGPTGSGHPGDAWGWAAGAGLRLNFPMIGEGDYLQAQANYTEGALRYIFFTPNSNWAKTDGSSEAYGVLSDCVYGGVVSTATTTSCQLTSAWGFNASYEHHWSLAWQTSLYGGWDQVHYNAQANDMLCSAAGFGNGGQGSAAVAAAGCNNDWSTWFIGSRTQWNVSKTFYMGVDVMYLDLNGASTGSSLLGGYNTCNLSGSAAGCGGGQAFLRESNASNWTIRFRAHKDFLP